MSVFPDFSLQDEDGFARYSNEFHPGLFVWLRQYGCRFARQQAAQLRRLEVLEPMKLVIIAPCPPAAARAFRRHYLKDTPCILLCDTKLRTFQTLGLQRSARPPGWSLKALLSGHLNGPVQGDECQNGGILITRPNGEIHYRHRSARAGDHPSNQELQQAMRRLKF